MAQYRESLTAEIISVPVGHAVPLGPIFCSHSVSLEVRVVIWTAHDVEVVSFYVLRTAHCDTFSSQLSMHSLSVVDTRRYVGVLRATIADESRSLCAMRQQCNRECDGRRRVWIHVSTCPAA